MNNIKSLRKQSGMSQLELAKALGLSQGAIAHYEKGIRRLNVDNAKRILAEFNSRGTYCTFEDVFASGARNPLHQSPSAFSTPKAK
ncbi:helix-turn-helix transcriptional regulator [Symbiopectobacterium sp. RP]|uniref:helix-turn-helix transcriptional regulator n=1 Tax=Symbiopectobacterium sp. RP TaxID=3248553 RepID=UPI003D29F474